MKLIKLGNSDLQITPIGLGTWAIGGEGALGFRLSEFKLVEIETQLPESINMFELG